MHKVLIAGAGHIGSLIACLLSESGDYDVVLADLNFSGADSARLEGRSYFKKETLDLEDDKAIEQLLKSYDFEAIISALPFFCNIALAKKAKKFNLHYFDLTEDTLVVEAIKKIAQDAKTAFVPQCGLAPGFVGIVANNLVQHFENPEVLKLRVGALPVTSSNAFQYLLTWSVDGLINQYGNPCAAIEDYKRASLRPLEGLESLQIDGVNYEAFNTSGGVGSLVDLFDGKVKRMNYKTIRHQGHCAQMKFLMNDLNLNEDRETLKHILQSSVPKTYQDIVIVYVSVTGQYKGDFLERNYVNKIYPQEFLGDAWSAIQIATASSICVSVDLVFSRENTEEGFVYQEKTSLEDFLNNRFGRYYAHK